MNILEANEKETHNDVVAESSSRHFPTENTARIDLGSARHEPAPGQNLPQTRGAIEKRQFEADRTSVEMHQDLGHPLQYLPTSSGASDQLAHAQGTSRMSPLLVQGHVPGSHYGRSKDQLVHQRPVTNSKWTHQGSRQSPGRTSQVQRLR